MSVNIKVTGGLNIEWGQIDPTVTGGLKQAQLSFQYIQHPPILTTMKKKRKQQKTT